MIDNGNSPSSARGSATIFSKPEGIRLSSYARAALMSRNPTDVIQSFRLRFWREPRQGAAGVWRGDVWHEQQNPGDEAFAVADPDEAFALVRKRLYGGVLGGQEAVESQNGSSVSSPKRCLAAIWRKITSLQQ